MTLFCAAKFFKGETESLLKRFSFSLEKFSIRSHVHIFSCAISPVSPWKYPYFCFSSYFFFIVFIVLLAVFMLPMLLLAAVMSSLLF